MIKDYNTERDKLMIREYGRNIQKMVNYALTIEDETKRTRLAYIIVSVMQQINPNPNPDEEYYKRLWNHLYMISNYKLEIDYPYEVLGEEEHKKKPEKVPYSDNRITYRFYGKNMENSLRAIADMEDSEEKMKLLIETANQLKVMYVTWNRDIINDELIAAHILKITNGKLLLPEDIELRPANDILKQLKAEEKEMESKQPAKGKKKKYVKKPALKPKRRPKGR